MVKNVVREKGQLGCLLKVWVGGGVEQSRSERPVSAWPETELLAVTRSFQLPMQTRPCIIDNKEKWTAHLAHRANQPLSPHRWFYFGKF